MDSGSAFSRIDERSPTERHPSRQALIIVDMQDFFAKRGQRQDQDRNPQILRKIFDRQVAMIKKAKAMKMPIMVVEYETIEPTNAELMKHIGDYQPVSVVRKPTDGLFDDPDTRQKTKDILEKWGSKELVVMGANGGFCVEATIRGALHNG